MLRLLRRITITLAVGLVVGLTALVVVATVYEDEVKERLIGALNERLLAPVQVGEVELTLIKRFPRASIRMSEVLVHEVRTDGAPADTLLAAQDLYLEFNLWDLFGGSYTVGSIHGQGVRLYAGLDGNGAENYIIWRSDSTAAESSPIDLRSVSFDELTVRFRDARNNLEVLAEHDALELSGRFGATSEASLSGDARLLGIWKEGEQLLDEREAQVALTMRFGEGEFRIMEGDVQLARCLCA